MPVSRYVALLTVEHCGHRFTPGSPLALSDEFAAPLLAISAIASQPGVLPVMPIAQGELVRTALDAATGFAGGVAAPGYATPPQVFDHAVTFPPEFAWVPFKVARLGAIIKTTFVPDAYKPASGPNVWVTSAGNDSTGTGTYSAPYRTMYKALQSVAAHGTTLYVEAGEYNRQQGWHGESPAFDINVIAWGGPVVSSTEWEGGRTPGNWTARGSGAWRAARSSVLQVLDKTDLDPKYRVPRLLIAASTEAECIATPGSYWIDATGVTVRLWDSRQPDANTIVLMNVANGYIDKNARYFVQGVEFVGGMFAAFKASPGAAISGSRLVFDGCGFTYAGGPTSTDADGLGAVGVARVYAHRCYGWGNRADVFSYHDAFGVQCRFVEIDCWGHLTGTPDGDENDNISTAHDTSMGVRVCTTGGDCYGAPFTDTNDAITLNIGCAAMESRAVSGTPWSGAGYKAMQRAVQYLDACTVGPGLTAAAYADTTARQYVRNSVLPGVDRPGY